MEKESGKRLQANANANLELTGHEIWSQHPPCCELDASIRILTQDDKANTFSRYNI